ncbi:MAG: hypothetical protein DI530_12105 [Sphingomonas sp.]|uniref:hypothetical protein n=1 Tax=Sphingomonas sp. TaxID=28214 RepID=UPI000DBBF3DB|nr:hypothetical protein [Sphingomonas sp.]PZU77731.1 MAG: hypothetical protein DI530_12105 [Sphingomonas sp.]
MSGYDDMARHVRDALEEGEVQEDGSCIIRPEHYLQLNADFEAWDEADDAKSAEAEDTPLDESSITDAQIEEAIRHGFGEEAASYDPAREVLTAFAAQLDSVPFDTASEAFFSFDSTHGHARALRRAIRELVDRVTTIRPPYKPFWENPDGPGAA